jgi:hypothetical protein
VCGDVVHRSRHHAQYLAQLSRQPWIDPGAFAPKSAMGLESKGHQPCRKRRHDRCCFEIAPRRFRTWPATCRPRDPAIGSLLRPMSNSPTRQSAARRSMRWHSARRSRIERIALRAPCQVARPWLPHQRLKALTTSHPRVAIHTSVASKARDSMVMQSQPDRCSDAGVLVELAGSTTSGRSM